MKVELTPDAAQWIEAEIAAGAFPAPEDAVRHSVAELRINSLRATLDAAVAEGGSHTASDVRQFVREHLERRSASAAKR